MSGLSRTAEGARALNEKQGIQLHLVSHCDVELPSHPFCTVVHVGCRQVSHIQHTLSGRSLSERADQRQKPSRNS